MYKKYFRGYVLFRIAAASTTSFIVLMSGGCASTIKPRISRQNPNVVLAASSTSSWTLDSLSPNEATALTEGKKIPISVSMNAHGTGNYELYLKANKKQFHPFKLNMVQATGEQADFSGQASWFVKPRGWTEKIMVQLYYIEHINKTEEKVLLKQFARTYDVVCNEGQWGLVLFIKKHLKMCKCN